MATVLCIADDPYLTDLLRYALGREGYVVRAAHSGYEALRMLRLDGVDLIVLDDVLPDVDGRSVLSALRTVTRAPVVMLAARSRDGAIIADHVQGADAYVGKPFGVQTRSSSASRPCCTGLATTAAAARTCHDRQT